MGLEPTKLLTVRPVGSSGLVWARGFGRCNWDFSPSMLGSMDVSVGPVGSSCVDKTVDRRGECWRQGGLHSVWCSQTDKGVGQPRAWPGSTTPKRGGHADKVPIVGRPRD